MAEDTLESWTKEQLIAEIRRVRFADPNAQDWKKMLDEERAANVGRRAQLEAKLQIADSQLKDAREATTTTQKGMERVCARNSALEELLIETVKTVNELARRGNADGR